MQIFLVTLESVVFVFGIGFIGFWLIRKKVVPEEILKVISPLIVTLTFPMTVFSNILKRFDPEKMDYWWSLPLFWAGFTLFTFILILGMRYVFKKENRRESEMALFYPNAVFLPLPIIVGLYGEESDMLVQLFIFTSFFPLFIFNTYFFFSKNKQSASFDISKVFNPVMIATIAALAIKLSGFDRFLPDFVLSISESLGRLTIPLIMILIGGNLYVDLKKNKSFNIPLILKFVFIKSIIFPVLTLGALVLLKLPKEISLLVFLQSVSPPATTLSVLAPKTGNDSSLVNQLIVTGFIFSLISVPLAMYVFNLFFEIY